MKTAYKLVSRHKTVHYFAIIFIAISVAFSVASFNVLGSLITSLLPLDPNASVPTPFNVGDFALFLSLFILFQLFSFLFKFFGKRLINRNIALCLNFLRNNYSQNLLKLSYKQFNEKKKGHYYSFYVNNVVIVQNEGILKIYEFFEDVFWAISALFSLAFLFWPLLLIFIGLYILLTIANLSFNNYFTKIGKKYSEANNVFTGALNKFFDAYTDFYSLNKRKYYFNLQKENSDLLYKNEKEYIGNQFKPISLLAFMNLISQMVFFVAATLFVFYNFKALGSNLTTGSFLTVISIGSQALGYTMNILFSVSSVSSTKEIIKNYEQKKGDKIEKKLPLEKIYSFKLENISFEYKDKELTKNIFQDYNLLIEKNKKYVVVGKSGSGKSTLMKLILGMDNPSSGSVLVNDQKLENFNIEDLYKNISYVDKDIEFFKDSVKNNILLDKNMDDQEFNNILDIVDIDFKNRMDDILDENNKFSEGQKQKIALARALAQKKNIFFLDEAFANIDANSTLRIKQNLFSKDITVIEISHQINEKMEGMYNEIIKI